MTTFIHNPIAHLRLAALALIALAVLGIGHVTAPAAHAATAQQWRFGGPGTVLYSHTAYTLFNTDVGQYLVRRPRADGWRSSPIDLGFRTTSAPEWTIGRSWECGKRTCTIYYNRPIALRNETTGKYLKYGHTGLRGGINLVWSDTAVYEWSIRGRSPSGASLDGDTTPVTPDATVALHNDQVGGGYVAYGTRPSWEGDVVDLVWTSTL